jgi:hypothetical protein
MIILALTTDVVVPRAFTRISYSVSSSLPLLSHAGLPKSKPRFLSSFSVLSSWVIHFGWALGPSGDGKVMFSLFAPFLLH